MDKSLKQIIYFISVNLIIVSVFHTNQSYCQVVTTENDKEEGHVENSDSEFVEEFIPTDDWQVVKPGQAIPSGLHVKLNMETGEREAKLMDEANANSVKNNDKTDVSVLPDQVVGEEISEDRRMLRMKKAMEDAMKDLQDESAEEGPVYWNDGEKAGMMNMYKDHFTQAELKEALKKYRAEDDDVQDEALHMDDIKQTFRPIEELRKEMKDLNFGVKTDLEILRELYAEYQKEELTVEERLRILSDVEYHVHQIDNGVNFVDIGAMGLILKDLNHSNSEVRATAAFVIGSAAQSNPKVQIYLIEAGAMTHLIRMLSMETNSNVQNRVMYALSSIVRQFPFAQMDFLQQGGLQAMRDLCIISRNEKLKVKIVTLLGDLVHEQNSLVKLPDVVAKDKSLQYRIKQYKRVPLYDAVLDQGWCDLVPSLLYLTDHDHREKILSTMDELLVMHVCQTEFRTFESALDDLYKEYETLVTKELSQVMEPGEESYFARFIELILNLKKRTEPSSERDEL